MTGNLNNITRFKDIPKNIEVYDYRIIPEFVTRVFKDNPKLIYKLKADKSYLDN